MAKESESDKKKEGPEQPQAGAAMIFEDLNKGDETVEAEASIRAVIRDHLEEFHLKIDSAVDTVEAFFLSLPAEAQVSFSDRGFLEALGDRYLGQLHAVGGPKAPLMDVLAREASDAVSFAASFEPDASGFLYHLRRAVRDACWYVRDNSSSILSSSWEELLKLATGGSFDFVPALIHLGLPAYTFNPAEFSNSLIEFAETWQREHGRAKGQVEQDTPGDARKEQQAQDEQQLMQEDPTKKEQALGIPI
jgi:hypothetical protein